MATQDAHITVPAKKITDRLTMNVTVHTTGVKRLRARIWLGTQLMKLAAFVIGMPVQVVMKEKRAARKVTDPK